MEECCKTCGTLRGVDYFYTGGAKAVICAKCGGNEWMTLQEFIQFVMSNLQQFEPNNRTTPSLPVPVPSLKRSCNRHDDCGEADKKWLANHPKELYTPVNFHCHNDECEECFGN